MGKIAVITDSNSGIMQKQAEQYGVVVVPMPFLIAGETYFEDVTLTHDAFFARLHHMMHFLQDCRKMLIFQHRSPLPKP